MKLKPIGDKLVIEMVEVEEKTSSGIVLPTSAKEAPSVAKVLAIGDEILKDEDKKDLIKVGDKIIFSKYAGTEVKLDKKEYIVLVDGNLKIKEYNGKQLPIVKGDAKSLSIAAASIIAKVTRDRLMKDLANIYPDYSFEKHKGYGTKAHIEAIKNKGAIEGVHRKIFLRKINNTWIKKVL